MTVTLLRIAAALNLAAALFGGVILADSGATGMALSFALGATLGALLLFALSSIVGDVRRIADRQPATAEKPQASPAPPAPPATCGSCGATNPGGARFCYRCGNAMG